MQSRPDEDIELGRRKGSLGLLEGYPTVAQFISQDSDASIFRSFQKLSARRLLYLQSQLADLEAQLERLDSLDAEDQYNTAARKAAGSWLHYSGSEDPRVQEHRALQTSIGKILTEYQAALMLQSQIHSLQKPTPRVLQAFRHWFGEGNVPKLGSHDANMLESEHMHDLVALAPVDQDRLNLFLQDYLGWIFRKRRNETSFAGIYYFPERYIKRAGAVIAIFLSAILLIGAIVCLMLVEGKSRALRIGVIVMFTTAFAAVVGMLTNARRSEIFGSTAAYAAVLVVFVSGNFTT